MTAVWCVKRNAPSEPSAAERLRVSTTFKWSRAAGQYVRHHTSGERNDIANDAGERQREHAQRNRGTVAAEIGHETEQVLRGRRMFLRRRFSHVSCTLPGFVAVAHRKLECAVLREAASVRKCS